MKLDFLVFDDDEDVGILKAGPRTWAQKVRRLLPPMKRLMTRTLRRKKNRGRTGAKWIFIF